MEKLSLKTKLAVGFGTLLLTLAMTAGVSYYFLSTLDALSGRVVDRSEKAELARVVEAAVLKEGYGTRGFLLLNQESMLQRVEEGRREYKEAADTVCSRLVTQEGKQLFGDIEQLHAQYMPLVDQIISLQRANKTKEALQVLSTQAAPISTQLSRAADTFVDHENDKKKQIIAEQETQPSPRPRLSCWVWPLWASRRDLGSPFSQYAR
jgi:CHASE3 domain sensor protein